MQESHTCPLKALYSMAVPPLTPTAAPPPSFFCPISLQIMRDPVFGSDGYSYERDEILKHLARSRVSPMTREALDTKLVPNRSLKSDIIVFMEAHPEHAADWYVSRTLSDIGTLVRQHKNAEVKAALVDHPEVALGVVEAGSTLFHLICQYGTTAMLADYLEAHLESTLKSKYPRPIDWHPVVLNARLFDCVRRGDVAAVRTCHQLGAELTAVDSDGLAPLSVAARDGQEAVLELLLDLGAPVNTRGGATGRTALHWAAASARASIVKTLVGRRAELHTKEANTGWTALHHAAFVGSAETCEALLSLGAQVNEADDKQWTCLHWASCASLGPPLLSLTPHPQVHGSRRMCARSARPWRLHQCHRPAPVDATVVGLLRWPRGVCAAAR